MAGIVEDLRLRLYGDGPGELQVEDLFQDSGLEDYERELVDIDAENPVVDADGWQGEGESPPEGGQSAGNEMLDLEQIRMLLQQRAAQRAQNSDDFQTKVLQENEVDKKQDGGGY